MSVDTELQHYECKKCHDVVSINNISSNRNNRCSKGGTCDWKKNQVSWNKSALGATVNLGVGLAKWGAKKAMAKGSKNNGEDEMNEEQENISAEEKNRIRAEKSAKTDEDFKQTVSFFKKYWWIALVLVGLLGARIIYLRMKNKAPENIEVATQPTENTTPPAEKNNVETPTQENNTPVESTNTLPAPAVNFEGTWKGAFGKDELTIVIESIDANGVVKGYDEVKGNKRILKGTLVETENGNQITVTEPGDDKWDGEFKMTYDNSAEKFVGEWKANNGKSKKEFSLTRN
jgi:hypothetical protein